MVINAARAQAQKRASQNPATDKHICGGPQIVYLRVCLQVSPQYCLLMLRFTYFCLPTPFLVPLPIPHLFACPSPYFSSPPLPHPGIVVPAPTYAMLTLINEITGPAHRGRFNLASEIGFVLTMSAQPGIALLLPKWRSLVWFAAALCLVFTAAWPVVLESPKWLLNTHRRQEAVTVLLRIAYMNGLKDEQAARNIILTRLADGATAGLKWGAVRSCELCSSDRMASLSTCAKFRRLARR